MLRIHVVLLTAVLYCILRESDAKVVEGSFEKIGQWHYFTRFCFDQSGKAPIFAMNFVRNDIEYEFCCGQGGKIEVEVDSDGVMDGQQKLAIYHDLADGFESVYDTGNSCDFKVGKIWMMSHFQSSRV